jgi:hypothetical protein
VLAVGNDLRQFWQPPIVVQKVDAGRSQVIRYWINIELKQIKTHRSPSTNKITTLLCVWGTEH